MPCNGMKWLAVVVLFLATDLNYIETAKILAIFPFQSRSHLIMGSALMKELLKRGHEITMISNHPEKEKIANYTDIYVKTTMMDVLGDQGHANQFFDEEKRGFKENLRLAMNFFQVNCIICDRMLKEESVHKLIHDKDAQFDVVILEAFFNDCFLGFVHKFKAPLIQVCTFGGMSYMGDWLGNPHPYSHVPEHFFSTTDRLNFWERTLNAIIGTLIKLARRYIYLPGMDAVIKENFGFLKDIPSIDELEYSISLLLLNTHFSISYPRPFVPGIVEVGGMHVLPPKKLPKDLQKYLDNAKDGVVYFSLGSNLQSAVMPDSKRIALLQAFSQLKQQVLWKWENDTMPDQPSNVRLGKWLPQSDILAHPNIRLFITHGGLLSTQEAMNRGVPIVGIPIFGDQENNMRKAQSTGIGVLLEFRNLTTESVKWAITEVLENPSYSENAQRISRVFRDQPLTPMEKAVYWTEYVIRHKGAPHMRSAALDLTWYQYFLLDVIAVLAIAISLILVAVFLTFRFIFRKCCGKLKQTEKIKKQ